MPAFRDASNDVSPEYLDKEKESDREFLAEWFEGNKWMHGKIGWVITVVNKYDLWSSDSGDVETYYSAEGEYGKKISGAIGVAKYTTLFACGEPDNMAQFRGRTANVRAVGAKDVAIQNGLFIEALAQKIRVG